ncbi:MAG: nitroreductase family protein [Candidatus Hadarchaeota archaeon]
MDVFEAMKARRSVRAFKQEPLAEGDLEKILEAARQAPSAGNTQPWDFVVVGNEHVKEGLVHASGQKFISQAPVVVVVCADTKRASAAYGKRGGELYCIQDTAAAVEHIHLAAVALGYGTCWVGAFDEGAAAKAIDAPEGVRPVAIIPMGRPAEKPKPTSRLPLGKIVHENGF